MIDCPSDEYGNYPYCPYCESSDINKEGYLYFFYTCRKCKSSYDPSRLISDCKKRNQKKHDKKEKT